ncbi:MAG: hypothetical protein OXC62_03740, partial [Aestuariivita sp.]|nr:hypothetical protein [Aestuariivita sp.]
MFDEQTKEIEILITEYRNGETQVQAANILEASDRDKIKNDVSDSEEGERRELRKILGPIYLTPLTRNPIFFEI